MQVDAKQMQSGSSKPPGADLLTGLFRHEAGRLVASLSRVLGPHNIELAEDVVQDALETALQSWKLQIPDNPAAWLTRVARNRALDLIRRAGTERRFAAEYVEQPDSEWMLSSTVEDSLSEAAAAENQIRMMLTICQVDLGEETHVTLILKFLCGFSTREIAAAYLTSDATIDKRLQRGRAALKKKLSLVPSNARFDRTILDSVLAALYLLFSEGYHGSHASSPVRGVLCEEALRLCALLTEEALSESDQEASPNAHALMALMCLHFARIEGRVDAEGALLPLELQDRLTWSHEFIDRGVVHLAAAASGVELSRYHLEAGIACLHCTASSVEETNWSDVLHLYELLKAQSGNPVVAICCALARAMCGDVHAALIEIVTLGAEPRLLDYPFYWAARGEINARAQRADEAAECFGYAARCARNPPEQHAFLRDDWWGRLRIGDGVTATQAPES